MSYNYRNLVFEGGGVKGIAYGGALSVLESMNILPGIKRVAGTSAGAISACLLSIGYSASEVGAIISGTNFSSFQDKDMLFLSNAMRVINKYGFYKGDAFTEWLGEKIKTKTGTSEFTFGNLLDEVNAAKQGFRKLYVVTTNLSQQRAEILSHETYMNMKVKDAIRMSMSIPLFFKAIFKNNEVMVDGGVSWNYPINIFDYTQYLDNPANGIKADYADSPNYIFNNETLGFRLDSKDVIDYAKHQWALPPEPVNNVKDYAGAVLNFMMEMANKSHLHGNDWNRTVFIDTLNIKTTQFDLSPAEIKSLTDNGKIFTEKYFEWKNSDAAQKIIPV